jgi:hypothetical protein
MIIYTRLQKSKSKRKPKAVREQYEQWLASHQPIKKIKAVKNEKLVYSLTAPAGREPVYIPSLNSGVGNTAKANPKVYTGEKMLGIATMHKSNAVPVFNSEEAVQISSMRR